MKLQSVLQWGVCAAVGVIVSASPTFGANTWKGAGGGGLITATDVNDPANWDDSAVPGANLPDDAIFNLTSTTGTRAGLTIPAAGAFAPDGMLQMYDSQALGTAITNQKSLTMTKLKLRYSGTTGALSGNRFVVSPGVNLTLSGATPLDLTEGFTAWSALILGASGADTTNAITLTGSSVSFGSMAWSGLNPNCDGDEGSSRIQGGAAASTAGKGPRLDFAAVGGTVNIAGAGRRKAGTLSLGNVDVGVRSDQTWTCDATGFISRLNECNSTGAGVAGPYLIESLDGGALNNLDQLNIRLGHAASVTVTKAEAMRVWPGEYGSLYWTGGSTTIRDRWLKLVGHVAFKGAAVTPGAMSTALDPVVIPYGLIVDGENASSKYLSLDGYNVSIVNGLLITDRRAGNSDTPGNRAVACVLADGTNLSQTVTVGGDLKVWSTNQSSTNRVVDSDADTIPDIATPFVCLNGGTNGITLSVGGSFIVNTIPWENGTGQNLRYSTVSMTGGTVGSPKTWEVGDKSSQTGLALKTFAVAVLNVGDGATGAYTALTNAYLNGNPIAIGGDPSLAKLGEKLIVGTLNIKADSTLNANGQATEVNTALTLASTATLDLNTGLPLAVGDRVTTFVGIGNQTAAWTSFAAQVTDSSVPGATFKPTLHTDGNTYWVRTAGSGTVIILK